MTRVKQSKSSAQVSKNQISGSLSNDSPKLNILLSYHYLLKNPAFDAIERENEKRIRWICDSGGFTAWKLNRPIELQRYIDWLHAINLTPKKPWKYFSLDEIGNPKKSRENFLEMKRQGLNPIPIFTRGGTRQELEEYYEHSDIVALGGLVGTKGNRAYVNGVMEWVAGRRVHLLGFVNERYIKYYRPYMVDSSNWASAQRFGSLAIYLGGGNHAKLHRSRFFGEVIPSVDRALNSYGTSWRQLMNRNSWRGEESAASKVQIESQVRWSIDCERYLNVFNFISICSQNIVNKHLLRMHKKWAD